MQDTHPVLDANPYMGHTSSWKRASEHAVNSMLRANKAALTAVTGVPTTAAVEESSKPDLDEELEQPKDWEYRRTVVSHEKIGVGDWVEFTKPITDVDVKRFALASGDTNPLHLNDDYAEETMFDETIAHGTLVSGLISAALARLPGLIVYVSQDTKFLKPVVKGEKLTARCEVAEDLGDGKFRLITYITDQEGDKIVDGEAIVLIKEEPPVETEPSSH